MEMQEFMVTGITLPVEGITDCIHEHVRMKYQRGIWKWPLTKQKMQWKLGKVTWEGVEAWNGK